VESGAIQIYGRDIVGGGEGGVKREKRKER